MTKRQQVASLVESPAFQRAIIGVIVFNACTIGLETSTGVEAQAGELLHTVDRVVIAIFVVELLLRIYAHGWRFFRDPWSVFDFLVVGIALVPASAGFSVLRALRILRAMRLVSAVPGMRKVVGGLLRALPAMGSIVVLLCLVLYVGAVLATELYGPTVPEYFGDLGRSLFTLFQVMTGEAWPDIAREVLAYHPTGWIFFVLFILVCSFVVLNLFTAVIVSFMEPERGEEEIRSDETVLAEIRVLRAELEGMRGALLGWAGGHEEPTPTGGVAVDESVAPAARQPGRAKAG